MKKRIITFIFLGGAIIFTALNFSGCAVSQKINDKTGTQLWGENCSRCHNPPGPGEFNSANWDIIGVHMRIRANITATEEYKIIEYLKNTGN